MGNYLFIGQTGSGKIDKLRKSIICGHYYLLLIILIAVGLQAEYHPLTEAQKGAFRDSYQAVRQAFEEKNYISIIRFTPEIIARYESIQFDPDCKKLRTMYNEMSEILNRVKGAKTADSLEAIIARAQLSSDKKDLLVSYDTILPVLFSADSSRFRVHYDYYQHIVSGLTSSNKTDTYTFLSSLKYVDPQTLEKYGKAIRKQFDIKIAELSAAMNPDSILAFQKLYPHIEKNDISALLERSRLSMRQSISRHPTIYDYLHYRELFGDDKLLKKVIFNKGMYEAMSGVPDIRTLKDYVKLFPEDAEDVWGSFEDSLYVKWSKTRDPLRADNYFRFYPQGRYTSLLSSQKNQPVGMNTEDYHPEW